MRHLRQQRASHPVDSVDPRTRLVAAGLLLALVVSSRSSIFPSQVAAICLPVTLLAGMPSRTLVLRLLHPFFIAAVILLLKTFMGTTTALLLQAGPLAVSGDPVGLQEGLLAASRIIGAVSVAILFSQVTSFTETMAALAWLRVPRGLVEVSLFAWRTLFTLYDDAAIVYTAQKNRLGYCGIRRGLKSFGAMAGMLVIRAFDSSQAMTVAMTQRGYDGNLPLLRGDRPGTAQLAGLALFALIATAAWKLQN